MEPLAIDLCSSDSEVKPEVHEAERTALSRSTPRAPMQHLASDALTSSSEQDARESGAACMMDETASPPPTTESFMGKHTPTNVRDDGDLLHRRVCDCERAITDANARDLTASEQQQRLHLAVAAAVKMLHFVSDITDEGY